MKLSSRILLPVALTIAAGAAFAEGPIQGNEVFAFQSTQSRAAVLEQQAAGRDVILEIDWQGAQQVRALLPGSLGIFILPPSRAVLRERLAGRGQDSAAVIETRMSAALDELTHYAEFDYLVVNDVFETALEALRAIILGNRQRRANQEVRHADLLQALLS